MRQETTVELHCGEAGVPDEIIVIKGAGALQLPTACFGSVASAYVQVHGPLPEGKTHATVNDRRLLNLHYELSVPHVRSAPTRELPSYVKLEPVVSEIATLAPPRPSDGIGPLASLFIVIAAVVAIIALCACGCLFRGHRVMHGLKRRLTAEVNELRLSAGGYTPAKTTSIPEPPPPPPAPAVISHESRELPPAAFAAPAAAFAAPPPAFDDAEAASYFTRAERVDDALNDAHAPSAAMRRYPLLGKTFSRSRPPSMPTIPEWPGLKSFSGRPLQPL